MFTFLHKHWKWLLAISLLIIVAASALVAAGFKEWRAGQLVTEARAAADAGDWMEARRNALASGQLHPSVDATRLFLEAQVRLGDPGILRTAGLLFTHPDAAAADRVKAMRIYLDSRDLIGFAHMLKALDPAENQDVEVRFLTVRFLLALGKLGEAVSVADSVEKPPRDARFDLVLVETLIASDHDGARAEAFKRMHALLDDPDRKTALAAFRILARQPIDRLTVPLSKKALARFEDDISLPAQDQLSLALLRIRLSPVHRDVIVASAVARFAETAYTQLLSWLLRVGEAETVLRLTDSGEPVENLDVPAFRGRMTALRLLGKLDQLEAELQTPPDDLSPVELFALRAFIARLMEKNAEEAGYWNRAFGFAEIRQSDNQYYLIAEFAAKAGALDQQMEALARAIEHPVGVPPLSSDLAGLFAWLSKHDTKRLLSVSRHLLSREPGNPILLNNYYYLQCLYQQPNEESLAALHELVTTFPEDVKIRGSLALALLKNGEPGAAKAILDDSALAPEDLPAGEKAVYAGALAALERASDAQALAESIDWDRMSLDEAEAFRELLKVPEETDI